MTQLDPFFETKLRQRNVVPVSVTGRILTPDGRGLRSATVTIIAPNGSTRSFTSSSFGNFQFSNFIPGGLYTLTVGSKRYRYAPRIVQVIGDLSNLDLQGLE